MPVFRVCTLASVQYTYFPFFGLTLSDGPQCTLLIAIIANTLCLSLCLSLSGFCRPIALHIYTCMYTLSVLPSGSYMCMYVCM